MTLSGYLQLYNKINHLTGEVIEGIIKKRTDFGMIKTLFLNTDIYDIQDMITVNKNNTLL